MADRHPTEEQLLDLAISGLGEQDRDNLTGHLAQCAQCREEYAGIAESIDNVLTAAPWVAPPPGFSRGALAAMGMTGSAETAWAAPGSGPGPGAGSEDGRGELPDGVGPVLPPAEPSVRSLDQARHRRTLPSPAWLTALVAVLALLAGALGATLWPSPDTAPQSSAAAGQVLTTGAGQQVGNVLTSWYDGEPVVVVAVTGGKVGKRYECRFVLADGTRQSAGSWVLREQGSNTWVVDRPEDLAGMELVAESGRVWATAQL